MQHLDRVEEERIFFRMTGFMNSYFSPKLEPKEIPEKGGYGVFARQPIRAGELVIVWGGRILSLSELEQVPEENRRSIVQVEENIFSLTMGDPEPADYINHSCNPNVGLKGQIALVAMRDIAPGEEACYDYAMTDSCPYDEFECVCGAANCRGWITGNDWKRPELWARYQGYFSPYLERRIERLKQGLSDPVADGIQTPEALFKPAEEVRLRR
jgi:uncharacterized protein